MFALKLKGRITSDRKLIVDIPQDVLPGPVEVILLQETLLKTGMRSASKTKHPAFGVWADRSDITDSAEFAAELRKRL